MHGREWNEIFRESGIYSYNASIQENMIESHIKTITSHLISRTIFYLPQTHNDTHKIYGRMQLNRRDRGTHELRAFINSGVQVVSTANRQRRLVNMQLFPVDLLVLVLGW